MSGQNCKPGGPAATRSGSPASKRIFWPSIQLLSRNRSGISKNMASLSCLQKMRQASSPLPLSSNSRNSRSHCAPFSPATAAPFRTCTSPHSPAARPSKRIWRAFSQSCSRSAARSWPDSSSPSPYRFGYNSEGKSSDFYRGRSCWKRPGYGQTATATRSAPALSAPRPSSSNVLVRILCIDAPFCRISHSSCAASPPLCSSSWRAASRIPTPTSPSTSRPRAGPTIPSARCPSRRSTSPRRRATTPPKTRSFSPAGSSRSWPDILRSFDCHSSIFI